MRQLFCLLVIIGLSHSIHAQIPVETYRAEIAQLEDEKEIAAYRDELHRIDQEVLVRLRDPLVVDSLSIDNMIKTALVFEQHQFKGYNIYNDVTPILNLSHNYTMECKVAFWPVIEMLAANSDGRIMDFGGTYPAYPLECVFGTIYDYSVFREKEHYPRYLRKMGLLSDQNTVEKLTAAYDEVKRVSALEEVEELGSWYSQSIPESIDKNKMNRLVRLSDGELYFNRYNRYYKLSSETDGEEYLFKPAVNPMKWYYTLDKNKNLTLFNEAGEVKMKYTKTAK